MAAEPYFGMPARVAQAEPAIAPGASGSAARTVSEVLAQSQAEAVMDELDRDLVGLAPVKARIRATRTGKCSACRCST